MEGTAASLDIISQIDIPVPAGADLFHSHDQLLSIALSGFYDSMHIFNGMEGIPHQVVGDSQGVKKRLIDYNVVFSSHMAVPAEGLDCPVRGRALNAIHGAAIISGFIQCFLYILDQRNSRILRFLRRNRGKRFSRSGSRILVSRSFGWSV